MTNHIRLRSGRALSLKVIDYDNSRPAISRRTLRSVCYAPFLSMDFDATGAIRLCNHSHTAIASVTDDTSILDIWRGEVYRRYRDEMRQCILDEENCRHCVRQCEAVAGRATPGQVSNAPARARTLAGLARLWADRVYDYRLSRQWKRHPDQVFAVAQFDRWAHDDLTPAYPRRLIFRLNSTCNLACVMCDGLTSSRIRRERDGLPLAPSRYGARFFHEMEEILPHVDHVEFYGGEPFLVEEHVRIFEIIRLTRSRCSIYVNTNGVSLHRKAIDFLEELNFTAIAVSMDAVHDEVHREVRHGLRHDRFHKNLDYFLDLRSRRGVNLSLNVTEHRKNWFELPEVFRFAQVKRLYIHINTCIHPHNVTLYTLPSAQLAYVLAFLEQQRHALSGEYRYWRNRPSYDFLLSLIRAELGTRSTDWRPEVTNRNHASDGFLAAPIPGLRPFETPAKVSEELRRIVRHVGGATAAYMVTDMIASIRAMRGQTGWMAVAQELEHALADLPVCAPNAVFQ